MENVLIEISTELNENNILKFFFFYEKTQLIGRLSGRYTNYIIEVIKERFRVSKVLDFCLSLFIYITNKINEIILFMEYFSNNEIMGVI